MVVLKSLVDKYQWRDIYRRMAKLYPTPKKNLEGYKRVFKELQKINMLPQGKRKILIELQPCYDQFDDTYFTNVHGVTPKKRGSTWAFDFYTWDKWLGMEIYEATLIEYGEINVICHCLYDMTFWGFNQDDINKEFEGLDSMSIPTS